MELLTGSAIRDFKVRGNYVNQRSLLYREESHGKQEAPLPKVPGYSPPVAEVELEGGGQRSVTVSETDVPALCDDDLERAKTHLALIVSARQGDTDAVRFLAERQHPRLPRAEQRHAAESRFVVPCTSAEDHPPQHISQKGSILLKLARLGYPVPDFVVLSSQAYLDGRQTLEEHLGAAIEQLQILTLQSLGDARDPLVFALRCATPHYIPGVMDTYLNVGVTERTLTALQGRYGAEVAQRMYLNNLRNLCHLLDRQDTAPLAAATRSGLPAEEVARAVDQLASLVRRAAPRLLEDEFFQTLFFVQQGYEQFEDNRELLLTLGRGKEDYPALILQKMVCTIRHEEAYAGVLSSRNTQTGLGMELQTAHNIFGEEIMTGTAEIESTAFSERAAIREQFPAAYHFAPHLRELEAEFESPVTIEFAVEATRRYQSFALLQLNETGMAGRAALIAVMDMHKAGAISRQRVAELIRPYHIKQVTSDSIDQESFAMLNNFCSGVAVLPRSAVSARVYFSGEAALTAKGQGERACLCKKTFLPTDTVVMREMDAIISLTSAAIHVVTICQSLGIPALLSLEKNGVRLLSGGGLVNSAGREIQEGDWITISSRRRTVYEGKGKFQSARLLRYMQGETVDMDPGERESFAAVAYAYRYYLQVVKGLAAGHVSTLEEVTRLVNVELRGETEEATALVNSWFDEREHLYVEQVLKSDIGDHLVQSRVFESLTLDRKIRFFKLALAKCARHRMAGYEAGAFMLGRFLSSRYPVAFWKCFTPAEISQLVNEWVLFEKYMQLLNTTGERKLLQARKKILSEGLDELRLHPGYVKALITMKLAGAPLSEARAAVYDWSDPQTPRVLEILQQPYRVFYDFSANWSLAELKTICGSENIPLPQPDEA